MAFGKDDTHLDNIGGYGASDFGQQASQASNRPKRSRGTMPYWRNNFDISENPATPDVFRIIRGAYKQQFAKDSGDVYEDTLPFYVFREHFHGSASKGAICSGGPFYIDRKKRQPCEGCEMYWTDYTERQNKKNRGDNSKGPNRISMTDKYAFTVWDYGVYFDLPQVDRNGQFRMNPKTNQPYTEWTKAYNLQDPRFQGYPWKQGDLRPWAVGKTWKDTLVNWTLTIGQSCVSCGAQGSVVSKGWFCGNPSCRQLVFDPSSTTLPADQQLKKTREPHDCPVCKQRLFMHEEVACRNCGAGRRASIFDVDLQGFRQRSGDGQQTTLVITSFYGPYPIRIQDPEVLAKVKPLDLMKIFAPTPIDVQRQIWNVTTSPLQQEPPAPAQPPQWAPPPGYPPQAPQQTYLPQQQPAPEMVDPNDINAQLAALARGI